jgi:tetratricopeptide (TPR) repeat protein
MVSMVSNFSDDSKIKYELNYSDFWKQNGDTFFNQQEYEKAIKCYDESISLDALNPDVWNRKGISFLKLGMVEEAIFCRSQLNSIISVAPTNFKEIPHPTIIESAPSVSVNESINREYPSREPPASTIIPQDQSEKYQETFIKSDIKPVSNILESPSLRPFNPFEVKDYKIRKLSGADSSPGQITTDKVLTPEEKKQKGLEEGNRNS